MLRDRTAFTERSRRGANQAPVGDYIQVKSVYAIATFAKASLKQPVGGLRADSWTDQTQTL